MVVSWLRYRSLMIAALCFGTICSVVSTARAVDVPRLPVEHYRLANGLNVCLVPDATLPRVTVAMAYHVGSKNERAGLTGFAHFFEHMMFRGTHRVPNFDIPLQEAGGAPNAFTTEDVTVYYETVPANYLQRVLYMEAERMAFLPTALDQEKFDTEREVVKNERRQTMENVPYGLAEETILAHLFPPGHPYSWSVIGSMKDLDNATLEDLKRFFYEFYHPANAALVVVGNFQPDEARRWIEYYFGVIPPGPMPARLDVPQQPAPVRKLEQADRVELTRIYWAWPTAGESSPDRAALGIWADILGDGLDARLYQALVATQRAVEVRAVHQPYELAGSFLVFATVAPGHSVEEVENVLRAEVRRMVESAPDAREVQRAVAKHQVAMLQRLSGPEARAFAVATGTVQYQDPHYYQRYFREEAQLTVEDLHRVATQYFSREPLVLVVRPVQPGESETPAVQVGPTTAADRTVPPRQIADDARWSELPEPAPVQEFPLPTVTTARLSNGLVVWFVERHSVPLVSTQLVVAAGSTAVPEGQEGLAALTARLWERGTRELTAAEFATQLGLFGSAVDTSADAYTTSVRFSTARETFGSVAHLIGQMVAQPRFDDEDIRKEKEIMLSQLRQGRQNPTWVASRLVRMLLYPKQHPLARPPSGYEATVDRLEAQQVRDFYQAHFRPEVSTLILVGDVSPQEMLPVLEDAFGAWSSGQRPLPSIAADVPPDNSFNAGRFFAVDVPGAVQSVLIVAKPWTHRRADHTVASEIANRIIGGDFLSRLNQNLREKHGYTYGARSGFAYHPDCGEWLARTSVRADVTAAALREMLNELEASVATRTLTDDEIHVARLAELHTFPESFETLHQLSESLADFIAHRLPLNYWQTFRDQLQRIQPEEVRQAARKLLGGAPLLILVVGDRATIEPQLRQAGWQEITWVDADGR